MQDCSGISALNLANELIKLRRNGSVVDSDLGSKIRTLRERGIIAHDRFKQLLGSPLCAAGIGPRRRSRVYAANSREREPSQTKPNA